MVLPSAWVSLLAKISPREARLRLGADKQVVRQFWEQFCDSPTRRDWMAQHFVLVGKTIDELSSYIPLTVHEDAGPCTKQLSARCLSFSSLLATGNEKYALSHGYILEKT